jgi:FAD binding domain
MMFHRFPRSGFATSFRIISRAERAAHELCFSTKATSTPFSQQGHCHNKTNENKNWCLDSIYRDILAVVSNNRDQVSNNPYDLQQHGKDESYHAAAAPDLVVYPRSAEEIQGILAIARQHRVPVIPYGAGTSVEGHINAIRGGISMGG